MAEQMWDLLVKDEDAFMQKAGRDDLSRAAARFRQMAREADTPQRRDFYADRAYQFSMRAASF